MFELIADGGDTFITIEFEEISEKNVKIVIYGTGYKKGGEWEKQFKDAISAFKWSYKKLIERFENNEPVDWSKQ